MGRTSGSSIRSVLTDLTTATNNDGSEPWAGLVSWAGTLYGPAVFGGTNGNGTIFSLQFPAPVVSKIIRNPDASVTLTFSGSANNTYLVQAASSLTPPINWQNISTNVADVSGSWQVTDASANGQAQRFYRASTP